MTRPLEAACNSLRAELNTVHRRLLAHLEGRDLPLRLRDGPSKKVIFFCYKVWSRSIPLTGKEKLMINYHLTKFSPSLISDKAHVNNRFVKLLIKNFLWPKLQANYKIMAARLQHEIKELQQKAKAAKLRLESEIKVSASFQKLFYEHCLEY